jgi:cytochrome P450
VSAHGGTYFDAATLADPYAFYGVARADGPVVDVSRDGRETWLVVGYEAVSDALRAPDVFSSRPVGIQGVNHYPRAESYLKEHGFGRVPHVIVMDPPRHTAHRAVLARLLRDKHMHRMRPQVRAVGDALVDGFASAGRCEFVRDYAWKLSVLVVSDLLGLARGRIDDFKRWSDAWVRPMLRPLTEDEMMECVRGIAELQHFLVDEIAHRRAEPRDDLLTDVANATVKTGDADVPLRTHEQLALCEALIVAGNDSTANALSLGMLRLVEFPAIAERLRAEPSLVERFAEESLRFEAAVQTNFRVATTDVDFHGVRMHKGAMVLLCWGAANRDPAQFPSPDAFDVDRPAFRTHHAFGGGIHGCAGAALARQELVESFALLLRRLANLRLDDGVSLADLRRSGGIVTHGLERLPIRFDVVG